jgi:hypothetical protein
MKYRLLFAILLVATGINAQTVAGDFKITGGTSPTDWEYTGNVLTIKNGTAITIEMASAGATTTADRIVVANGVTANITLQDVKIDLSLKTGNNNANCPFFLDGTAKANLTLLGANVLKAGETKAGLFVPSNAELTITAASTGSLEAAGGAANAGLAGAGIGGHNVNGGISGIITILGGNITATGGNIDACGIGAAGANSAASAITITDGIVKSSSIGSDAGTSSLIMNGNAVVYANIFSSDVTFNSTTASGILFKGNSGTVYGNVSLNYDPDIPASYTLAIPNAKSITVPAGKSFTNAGTVDVQSGGLFTNNGTLKNSGTVDVKDGSTVTSISGTVDNNHNKINGANVTNPTEITADRTHTSIKVVATMKATTDQTVEYGMSAEVAGSPGPITWGNFSGEFTGLTPNTPYYFYARSGSNEHFFVGTESSNIKIRTRPIITGSVSISGDVIYGSQLTATYNNRPNDAANITYTWYSKEGANAPEQIYTVTGAQLSASSYTLTAAEVGKNIIVVTSVSNYGGTLEDEVGPVQPRPITFTGDVSASKVYDGNDIFTAAQITIDNITSFSNILPADVGVGEVELVKTAATGKFGPAPGTGTLSDVSGFTLTGNRANNYTLIMPAIPAEIVAPPTAKDDRMFVFACQSKTVNVLANDINVSGGTLTIETQGKLGSATASGTDVTYDNPGANCRSNGGRRDTVIYKICTTDGCAEAKLIIDILRMPSVVLMDSCSLRPYLTIDYQYSSACTWYTSSTGAAGSWTAVPVAPSLKLYVMEEAWYKAVITYKGDSIETAPVKFVIRSKTRLAGNRLWYDTTIEN